MTSSTRSFNKLSFSTMERFSFYVRPLPLSDLPRVFACHYCIWMERGIFPLVKFTLKSVLISPGCNRGAFFFFQHTFREIFPVNPSPIFPHWENFEHRWALLGFVSVCIGLFRTKSQGLSRSEGEAKARYFATLCPLRVLARWIYINSDGGARPENQIGRAQSKLQHEAFLLLAFKFLRENVNFRTSILALFSTLKLRM